MSLNVVILAAGKGTRMYSDKPKVLHSVGGRAMLEHVIAAASALDEARLHVVVGADRERVKQYIEDRHLPIELQWVTQQQQFGTGHAVYQALPGIDTTSDDGIVLILFGDVPLIQQTTLRKLIAKVSANSMVLLTATTDDPSGLGRIVRDEGGHVKEVIEEKDANQQQKLIKEFNSGVLAAPAKKLNDWISRIGNKNEQNEYYLTDIIALAVNDGCDIETRVIENEIEVQGVNDKHHLVLVERYYQMKKANELLQAGVTLMDSQRIEIRGDIACGKDVEIDVGVIFEGRVTLADGVKIGANVIIKDAIIEQGVEILSGSNIDGATIGAESVIGPYARIRPGTILKNKVKIGNFVEIKNVIIGSGSKASHLAYIGDAELGKNVNIGAGVIVCNYDGVNKHKTRIGNDVFVGSNSVLVAPVILEDGAFIAAGSTINNDVPAGNLALGRARQRNIDGWEKPVKKD
jgi:bifunctional UDP-N-acetylglucosamine pyrophosphorylase/glucosamine-1-phosphate N-acetyltransferase